MRNKLGVVCMALGTLLILSALGLLVYNQQESDIAGDAADVALEQVAVTIQERVETAKETQELPDPYVTEMTVVDIDGYGYIGYLSIPVLDMELPIMSEWDYDRFKIAPCRYSGSTKTDDLVIAGHRYARHFSPIDRLHQGDEVIFTDMDGVVTHYEVAEVTVLDPTAVEEMASGEYPLTLFTCTYGGANRVTVRCIIAEDE